VVSLRISLVVLIHSFVLDFKITTIMTTITGNPIPIANHSIGIGNVVVSMVVVGDVVVVVLGASSFGIVKESAVVPFIK
jgi:hypothetical protein